MFWAFRERSTRAEQLASTVRANVSSSAPACAGLTCSPMTIVPSTTRTPAAGHAPSRANAAGSRAIAARRSAMMRRLPAVSQSLKVRVSDAFGGSDSTTP